MFYSIALYVSLAVFTLGLIYRLSNWFRYQIDQDTPKIPVSKRLLAAVRGIASTLFSIKFFMLLRIFFLDVLFQKFLVKAGVLRWFAHICIFTGFILLLLMHAMDTLVTEPLFEDYYSTLNPFLFLRNFLGLVVLLGLCIAIGRRIFSSSLPRLKSTAMDYYALSILALIMISGVLLESTEILSNTVYEEMVVDYSGLEEDDTDSLYALNAYWVEYYGVVSPNVTGPFDEEVLQEGKELHEGSCMECHSRPQWAFMSYGVSRILKPVASLLDRANLHTGLWYLHILFCFLGLAYLPFSKFFHIFSTPVFLLTKGVMKEGRSDPANTATSKVIEMDACVHCGDCTRRCSVAVALNEIPNPNILPSEKHAAFRSLLSGRNLNKKKLIAIQEGSYICTDCHRCTDICPIGIQMESLWQNLKQHVAELGYPKPEAWARQTIGEDFVIRKFGDASLSPSFEDKKFTFDLTSLPSIHTFSLCFGCQNCTNVCPVVAAHDSPRKTLGLLPHEIMHCLALRQKDLVLGSMMLWDCLTCYLCQEQCPQNVCVTDILYQLKNMALNRLKEEA